MKYNLILILFLSLSAYGIEVKFDNRPPIGLPELGERLSDSRENNGSIKSKIGNEVIRIVISYYDTSRWPAKNDLIKHVNNILSDDLSKTFHHPTWAEIYQPLIAGTIVYKDGYRGYISISNYKICFQDKSGYYWLGTF